MGRYVAAGCEKKNNIARADVNEAVKYASEVESLMFSSDRLRAVVIC